MLPKLEINLTPNNPDFVFDTEFWVVLLAHKQAIPRLIVFPKRYFGSLSELTTEELLDFQSNIVIPIEKVMKNLFQVKVCNWMCLMNESFKKSKEYQTLLHWHVRGRIESPIKVGNFYYEDKLFGRFFDKVKENELPLIDGTTEERQQLIELIFCHYRRFSDDS